jgi:Predicted transcriptional regulators
MEDIRERIKKALEVRGMMPVDLARKSGINKGSISKYLKGDVIPKQSAIGAMAEALHVLPSWLMGYDVPMEAVTPEVTTIDISKLSEENKKRLEAYYQALIDSQG